MINLSAIQTYLSQAGNKYIMPEKAGNLKEAMLEMKREGQAARLIFSQIAKNFQIAHPSFQLERVSNWTNQAQIARPHFWVYLREEDRSISDPLYAFRIYGNEKAFGISVEVSIIERKRDDQSLIKQHRILQVSAIAGTYYQYVQDSETIRLSATEEHRRMLQESVSAGLVRKVLVKTDISCSTDMPADQLTEKLAAGMRLLAPFYQETKINML